VWDIVETRYVEPEVGIVLTVSQTKALKEKRVDDTGFEKIAGATSAKEAWGILLTAYKGADGVKHIRLQTLRGEFELLRMNSTEGVSNYITRVQTMSNQLKRNGENLSEQRVVEKIFKVTLTDTFEDVVWAIEESKNLVELSVDELVVSLLSHEQRKKLKKRETLEETLQAKVVLEEKALYVPKAQQTRDVECYNCGKHEHIAQDCWAEKKVEGKANYAEVIEDEKVLLMAQTPSTSGCDTV
jgi:gag-polypeptide of LTR copia-type/Zinc knuckle